MEKIGLGVGSDVRCRQCGASLRLLWPRRPSRTWAQALALIAGLALSFYLLSPIPFGLALLAIVLAPALLSVAPNPRDPLTARRMADGQDPGGG